MHKIKLHNLHCILNVEVDADEIFLKYNGKKIWPATFYKSINSGEVKAIDEILEVDDPNKPLEIELWDYDFLSKNDRIGTFVVTIEGETKGRYQTNMRPNEETSTGSYLLEWEILS